MARTITGIGKDVRRALKIKPDEGVSLQGGRGSAHIMKIISHVGDDRGFKVWAVTRKYEISEVPEYY